MIESVPARPRRMAQLAAIAALASVSLTCLKGCASGEAQAQPTPAPAPPAVVDELTPVVTVAHTPQAAPVLGSDGWYHLVYELRLMNARAVQATLLEVRAVDAADSNRVLGRLEGAPLLANLRTLDNRFAANPQLAVNDTRLLLMHLQFDSRAVIPTKLAHRIRVLGGSIDAGNPAAVDQTYSAGPLAIGGQPLPVLGPPLKGAHWVAINGCCAASSVHRNTGLPVNGEIRFAQRFAIDWMRRDAQGFLVSGNANDVRSYSAYGADVIAVADGVVVSALDTLPDQAPPTLPAPETITLATADGNHVVLDIGGGHFAFYAHLQPGPGGVKVRVGDRVRRGQRIGTLGNSGNSSAPHLHFHVMDGPSVLGSNGVPYLIDGYSYTGQASDAMASVAGLASDFGAALFTRPQPRARSLPLDFAVLDFD